MCLTEQAVAESVPHAGGLAPAPAAADARGEGEVDAGDGHEQVAEADVEQQQVGGSAQALEPAVQNQNHHVVAEPEHSDGSDGESQKFVGSSREDLRRLRQTLREARVGARERRIHHSASGGGSRSSRARAAPRTAREFKQECSARKVGR